MVLCIILLLASVVEAATVSTSKSSYRTGETIHVHFSGMAGAQDDWLGIYPKGSSVAWENVAGWTYTSGKTNGEYDFSALPVGEYEVRVFFNNAYRVETSVDFAIRNANVSTTKNVYAVGENIVVDVSGLPGAVQDWIGIYPKGSSVAWENVARWTYTSGNTSGKFNFYSLPIGEYEVRVFFNNSYRLEASFGFSISNVNVSTTKNVYTVGEDIVVDVSGLSGAAQD